MNPEVRVRESIKHLAPNQNRLTSLFDDEMLKDLHRLQKVLSQGNNGYCSETEVLRKALKFMLFHKDPVQKAKRQHTSPKLLGNCQVQSKSKVPLRYVAHQISLRDTRACQFTMLDGKKCNQKMFVQVHHLTPRSEGGLHTLHNLQTLCSFHHKLQHG